MWVMWWGSDLHKLLKKIACEFPVNPTPKQQQAAKNLIESMFSLLPCKHCQSHARYYLQIHPLTAHSRNAFLDWLVTFHNRLNRRLGKRSNWTTQEAIEALVNDMNMEKDGLDKAARMREEDDKKIRSLYAQIAVLEDQLREEEKTAEEVVKHPPEQMAGGNGNHGITREIINQENVYFHECPGAFDFEENKETEMFTLCVLGFVAILLFVAFGLLVCKM